MKRWLWLVIISTHALSAPKSLEVWFLSVAKVAELERYLNQPTVLLSSMTSELQCQEMGDYCFDPQHGLYKRDEALNDVSPAKLNFDQGPSIPSGKSVDRELINCDPNNYFDVFCGKAKKEVAASSPKLDLWIDTSSSMREFDFLDKDGNCNRKRLVKAVDEACPFNQKVNVMMFDTSIKQAGMMDSLCNNQGLNDYKKLIDWIERSDAQNLIVITDIYELYKDFSDFVEKKDGKLRGDKDPLTSAKMVELAETLKKSCR